MDLKIKSTLKAVKAFAFSRSLSPFLFSPPAHFPLSLLPFFFLPFFSLNFLPPHSPSLLPKLEDLLTGGGRQGSQMYVDVPGLKLSEWRPPGGGIARFCGLSGPDWEGTVCSGAEEAPFSAGGFPWPVCR